MNKFLPTNYNFLLNSQIIYTLGDNNIILCLRNQTIQAAKSENHVIVLHSINKKNK